MPVQIRLHDLKQMRLPEINPAFLNSIGFASIDELREAVQDALKRRIETQQRQALRRQILDQLLAQTPFELPSDLVRREEDSTIRRLVMELRKEGITDNEIRASEAAIRANAHESTLRSLKELLLLSQIAEAEEIEVDEEDFAVEIEAMAERSGESPRRIRSRLEKEGLSQQFTTQILERKVIDRILQTSTVEDDVTASAEPEVSVETLDHAAAEAEAPATEDEAEAGDEAARRRAGCRAGLRSLRAPLRLAVVSDEWSAARGEEDPTPDRPLTTGADGSERLFRSEPPADARSGRVT